MRAFRNFIRNVKTFFWWGWKLRNDRDWDYSYLLQIVELKISRMIEEFKSDRSFSEWAGNLENKDFRKILEVRELLSKINKSDLNKNYIRVMENYRPTSECKLMHKLGISAGKKQISDELFNFYIKKAFKKDAEENNRIWKRLFFLMEKNMQKWWD